MPKPTKRGPSAADEMKAAAAPPAASRTARLPAAPRPPQQERGQRRVDAILDATAALIVEEGIASVTMHRVARRSGTTTGSMYHFFPDRETLLGSLAERHARELRALMARVEQDSAQWSQLPTDVAVNRFLDPILSYSDRHPDFRPLSRIARTAEWGASSVADLGRLLVRLAEAVVASRCASAIPAEQTLRALMVVAMIDGVTTAINSTPSVPDAPPTGVLRKELRRLLVLYLDSCTSPPAPHGARSASSPSSRTVEGRE